MTWIIVDTKSFALLDYVANTYKTFLVWESLQKHLTAELATVITSINYFRDLLVVVTNRTSLNDLEEKNKFMIMWVDNQSSIIVIEFVSQQIRKKHFCAWFMGSFD